MLITNPQRYENVSNLNYKNITNKAIERRLQEMELILTNNNFYSSTFYPMFKIITEKTDNEEYKNKFFSLIYNYLKPRFNEIMEIICSKNLEGLAPEELENLKMSIEKCSFLDFFDDNNSEIVNDYSIKIKEIMTTIRPYLDMIYKMK